MGRLVGRDRELTDLLRDLLRDRTVVLTGEAGAGKTMLLREAARRCRRRGWDLVEINPSSATRHLPLWPLHPLMPPGGGTDRDQLADVVRDSLTRGGDRSTLLLIDDAHHLDADSIELLHGLSPEATWATVATVRDGAPRDETLAALWSADDATELPLAPFDADGTGALATAVLGARVSPTLLDWLVDTSRGNALLIRELLLDARDQGTIVVDDDGWKLADVSRPALLGSRTSRCIQRRIGRLDDDAHRLLDLVALSGSIRVDQVPTELLPSMSALEERRLLVRRREAAGEVRLTVDHPLVAETVIDAMDDARQWSATWTLVELLGASTMRPGDASRVASWATIVGHPLDAERWVTAAREAIAGFDIDHALEWARAAAACDPEHHGAHRALGEALRMQGDLPEAAAALANAAATAVDEDDIVATALDRAALVGFQRGDPAEAMAILLTAVDRVRDPLRAMSLRSEAAVFGTLLGRFDDVMLVAAADPELRRSADPATRWTLGLNEVYALSMLGRVEAVADLSSRLMADDPSHEGERPHEVDLLLGVRGAARLQRGELAEGVAELDAALDRRRTHEQFRGVATAVLALLLDLLDDPRAAEAAAESVAQHAWMDPFGSTPIAAAVAAITASRDGRSDEAAEHLSTFDDVDAAGPWTAIWVGRARARMAFDAGAAEAASTACLRAGEVALDSGHRGYAAITLHDAVHYGGAPLVVEPLRAAVGGTSGATLLELMVEHAEAVAGADAARVADCALAFAATGARGLAAEAHSQRARILAAGGDLIEARRADFTGRAASPRGADPAFPTPLVDTVSDRELEVAVLAADGRTSAEIAAEVFLSKRTVDNHLHAVYGKLDVRGRDELARLLT
ncbi:MAG: AAA family ATPase [Acidimicrobiales bacterium]|nr:AAA family ATPase [Acidimicrobiales bacterium]